DVTMEKVVIIGGGYAGLYALRELVKNKNIKITLIDKHTFHNLQPEVYDLIANKSTIADVTVDLTTLCLGLNHPYLEYKNLKVRKIDQQEKKIYTEEKEIVDFDYLILAAGTRT
ncbi:FAD-dependent oxidoreductase, partial [Aliarcobacter cryaerophilus]|uniref:FAD-dependent oxidoreductase n=1 Tax=Aliarcobacter cryaerophilus TaxID=28198 RepID=UPI001D17D2ED